MYQRILLATDGSAFARAAFPHAAELAAESDCEVLVVEAIDSLETVRTRFELEAYEFASGRSVEDLAESAHFTRRLEAQAHVDEAAEALLADGVESVRPLVVEGLPGNAILDVAERERCGAIVMATRGHSGLGREVLGSVADHVLRHAGSSAVVLVGPRAVREGATTLSTDASRSTG